MASNLESFTDILGDEIGDSQPSFPSTNNSEALHQDRFEKQNIGTDLLARPSKRTGQYGHFRSVEEIDPKFRDVFSYPFYNLVQSRVIEDALYTDNSIVVCAPTGSGKTVIFEMAIVQLLMDIDDKHYTGDFKIIYMAPVKALCTERLTEWYSKFTKLGLLCIEVTGDTEVDFSQLKPYRVIITTPEKWDMLTRRWRDHKALVEVIKLFLIDEVHILNDETRGPVLEAVVSRMKTIESSAQSAHRIELLQKQYQGGATPSTQDPPPPRIRFVAVSATVSNPEDVATWLGSDDKPAVYHKFGDECRPVKLKRIVEGYPCAKGSSIFKFDIILNYKLWPIIQKYHDGKPTLIFCNTRKSVALTAETLSREITVSFSPEQKSKLAAVAATIKNKKLQALVLSGVGCHHAGLLYEERLNIERAFRNRDLPILITTTTLAMGVNLPAHLVIVKNTQQYVNGSYQEYSISTVLQMVGRAGRPQFDTEATAVIMTRLEDKQRYQSLVGGSEPLQSYLHRRLAENLNSEAALGTVGDVAQCVQWLRSTFLYVRAARDPKRYLGLHPNAPHQLISKKIEELCVKAMNGLASSGLISMDEASCITSTEAGRLMSIFYLDLETMKYIMTIDGTETLERLLWIICESHELADMHLRIDERRCLNALNRNNAAPTIRFPMKGKISTRQMKLNCVIQAVLGCLPIPDPALNQEAMKIMRIADRICRCLVAYVTRPDLICQKPLYYSAVLNALILAKCVAAHLWENSPYVSKQLKGIGPTFSTLLATAGKVNFRLLEESNPRDLERIMNKGAPAGNVIRKQISLLPKYQLYVKPGDERTVTIQLQLLNQNHLAENIDQLTAGDAHKCYIIVGDSDNKLLLFTAIKDRDLISVYGGYLSYDITRQHNSEYKIFAHCISSTYVGIDDNCEYVFQNLEPHKPQMSHNREVQKHEPKKCTKKQTSITDTFKERKRRNNTDITQSKEKKKRENALIERFKYLKESFGVTSKLMKENLNESAQMSNQIMHDLTQSTAPVPTYKVMEILPIEKVNVTRNEVVGGQFTPVCSDAISIEAEDSDEFMDDEKINCILSEIEYEISKESNKSATPIIQDKQYKTSIYTAPHISVSLKTLTKGRQRPMNKSNYNFIDLLEKNMDLSDDDQCKDVKTEKQTGFSDAIKHQINKYLHNTQKTTNTTDLSLKVLLDDVSQSKKVKETNYEEKDHTYMQDFECNEVKCKNTEFDTKEGCEKLNEIIGNQIQETPNTNNFDGSLTSENGLQRSPFVGIHKDVANAFITNDPISMNTKICDETTRTEVDAVNVRDMVVFQESGNRKPDYNDNKCELHDREITIPVSSFTIDDNKDKTLTVSPLSTQRADFTQPTYLGNKESNTKSLMTLSKRVLHPYISANSCFNESNQRINKYSYTATKIDVFTNELPEHRVRVVRKLKLDLGVTEIVTEEKICVREKHEVNEEGENYSNLKIEDFNDEFNDYKINGTPVLAICSVASNKGLQQSNKVNVPSKAKYLSLDEPTHAHYETPKSITNVKEPEPVRCLTNNIENNVIHNISKPEENIKQVTEERTQKPVICNYDKPMNANAVHTEKNVGNILQKYSHIFSQINKNDKETVHSPVVNDNNKNKTLHGKAKRPFTIRALPNLNAPIPKNIMDNDLGPNASPIYQTDKEMRAEKPEPKVILSRVNRDRDSKEQIELDRLILETDQLGENEPITTEDTFGIEACDPYANIDNSMLDPKALLQCMNNEGLEIVPPPPEFGDASPSYSPDNNSVDDSSTLLYNTGIFEENPLNIELSPSREVETWTLSRDWEDNNLFPEPNTSYTVVHQNIPVGFNNIKTHYNHTSRQARLGQYKFHKNKLKM